MRRNIIVLAFALLSISGTAAAQERGHVAGVFGWTFGQETATMYGAQVGVGINANIQIIGGVEKLQDVLTGRFALLLQNIAALPNTTVQGEIPATYGGVGARFTFPGLTASPFLEVQMGATQMDPTGLMILSDGDDVTDAVFDLQKSTNFTFVIGAGARFDVSEHVLVETTFKFFDILAENDDISLNRINIAVGVRF